MSPTYRWRKFSPIDRLYPIFELVSEPDGTILLDVTRDDAGRFEIAFHPGCAGRSLSLSQLESLLAWVKDELAKEEAI